MSLRPLVASLAALLVLQLFGCAANEIRPSSITVPNRLPKDRDPVIRANTSSTVEIRTRDGTVLRGRVLGFDRMSAAEYAQHCEEFLATKPGSPEALPAWGENVTVRVAGRGARAMRFDGFGHGTVELRDTTGASEAILWDDLIEMNARGDRRWTGRGFQDSAAVGSLPMFDRVRLEVVGREVLVPADQIVESRDRSKSILATGLLVALGLVAMAGIAVLADASGVSAW